MIRTDGEFDVITIDLYSQSDRPPRKKRSLLITYFADTYKNTLEFTEWINF